MIRINEDSFDIIEIERNLEEYDFNLTDAFLDEVRSRLIQTKFDIEDKVADLIHDIIVEAAQEVRG